jgi:hypothetical protein
MACIIITFPEQQEGKEGNDACLVMTDNLDEVKNIILGKGLGVQGYDDGISFSECDCSTFKNGRYGILKLSLEQLKNAVKENEISWHKVIEWQRWGHGYINEETKTVVLNKRGVVISTYFQKIGYKIKFALLP